MLKHFIFNLVLLFFVSFSTFGTPKGYRISVHLKNSTDTVIYLAHYYGDKQYIDDTARLDKKGIYQFEGMKNLLDGMYIIAGQKKEKYFDFFIAGEHHFDLQCDPADIAGSMLVKNSKENILFFNYIAYLARMQKAIQPLQTKMKTYAALPDSLAKVRKQIDEVDKDVTTYIATLIRENPGYLTTAFIKANKPPDIMPFLINAEGKVDSSLLFVTYKQHFFDNMDFADSRLIYTPVFTEKINLYLDKLVLQHPDSINLACDNIIQKGSSNKDVYKYLVWYLALRYEASEIMGFDAVFVYIVEKYYESGLAEWLYPAVKENILKRTKTLKPLLIGQPAPNMILMDTTNQPVALSAIKARYTLIFFWESTCGHCKTEVPKAIKLYQELKDKYDFKVFAVSSDTSVSAWKKYLRINNPGWINVNGNLSFTPDFHVLYDAHSTPVMYLLDENKIIIAKRILSDQIGDVIKLNEKRKAASAKETGG
jgi:thiol-disulfide isomerase/thioredoxin